ncbi:hypothetical protein LTR15_012801 [Elasticomyces elasticus]|nr:hypothetical protein LTR15_012801 [Elasticomyces elasticus]
MEVEGVENNEDADLDYEHMEVKGDGENEHTDFDHGHMEVKGNDHNRYTDSSGYDRLHDSLLNEIKGCEKTQLDLMSDDEGDEDAVSELEDESLRVEMADSSKGGGDGSADWRNAGGEEDAPFELEYESFGLRRRS